VPEGSADYISYDVQYANRLMNTYVEMAKSAALRAEVGQQLGWSQLPAVAAVAVPDTELIRLTVEAPSASAAVQAADAVAQALVARVRAQETAAGAAAAAATRLRLSDLQADLARDQEEYQRLVSEAPESPARLLTLQRTIASKQAVCEALLRQLQQALLRQSLRADAISLAEPAILPHAPVRPRVALNLALGLMVALAGGIGVAFLIEGLSPPVEGRQAGAGQLRRPLPAGADRRSGPAPAGQAHAQDGA
jgi:capsular polysaccharide biosynthesis protein